MKKLLIVFILTLTSLISFSQTILSLNVSPNGTDTVDVNIEVVTSTLSYHISESHTLNSNIITMVFCYYVTGVQQPILHNHTVSVNIPGDDNYTLNIEIYKSVNQTTCDYTELTDTATLEFTTPLTDTVYLGVAEFEEVTNQITVFPNPVKDFLNIKVSGSLDIKNIEIYNMLGSRIKSYSNTFESLDVRGLSNGMYFLRFRTNKGMVTKKILVSN